MAFSKAKDFPPVLYSQSSWSKALSHPARIIILTHLLENGNTPFDEISRLIPLSKTTVSQHLRFLRQSGLIEAYEQFPHTYYKINEDQCTQLAEKMKHLESIFIKTKSRN